MTKHDSGKTWSLSPPPIYFPIRARGGAHLYVRFENYRFDEIDQTELIRCIEDAEDHANEILLQHRGDSLVNERELTFDTDAVEIYIENRYKRQELRIMKWSTVILLSSAIRDFVNQEPHYTTFDFDIYNVTLSTRHSIAQGYVGPYGDSENPAVSADVTTF